MARTHDAANLSAIHSARIAPVYLAEFGFDIPSRLCSADTVTWNGQQWIDAQMGIKLSDSPTITVLNEDQLFGTQVLAQVASGRTVDIYRMYAYTRRNLLRYTRSFNSNWPNTGSVESEGPLSVLGMRSTTLREQSATGNHSIEQTLLGSDQTSNSSITLAVDAKLGAGNRNLSLVITNLAGTQRVARFTLTNGSILATPTGGDAAIHWLGDGWWRCIATASTGSGGGSLKAGFYLTSGSNLSYSGDGSSSVHLVRPQIEYGAIATDYQPVIAGAYTLTGDEPTGYTAPTLLYSGIIGTPRVSAKEVRLQCQAFPPLYAPRHIIDNPICNWLPRAGQRFTTTRGIVVLGE